jgi:hypothetical protein
LKESRQVKPFSNDGSLSAALIKTLKRTMAAEYSRELSAKVFAGQSRLTELGFRQGGAAGYGFRRLLIDQNGSPKVILRSGEQKNIATDRVILIPGPQEEIKIVQEVFHLYAIERRGTPAIARMLNERGVLGEGRRPWTRHIDRRIVTNPKYIGANVTNRQSAKLRGRRVNNPPELWIRKDNAFEAIVETELYRKAAEEAEARSKVLSDDQLLQLLGQLLRTSALGKSDPPLLSRNDPGILTGRSGPNTAARDEDYETSRCQRPGRDRALSAAGGSGRAREWEPGNGPAASRSAKPPAVKERKRVGAAGIQATVSPGGLINDRHRQRHRSRCDCRPR